MATMISDSVSGLSFRQYWSGEKFMIDGKFWKIAKHGHFDIRVLKPVDNMVILRRRLKVLETDLYHYLVSLVRTSDWKEFFITPGNEEISETGANGKEFLHQTFKVFSKIEEFEIFLKSHRFDWATKARIYTPRADEANDVVWLEDIGEYRFPYYGKEPEFDTVYLNGQKMRPEEAINLYRKGMIIINREGDAALKREAVSAR